VADGNGVVTDENLFHEKSNDTLALRNVQRSRRRAHTRHERRERLGQSQIVGTISRMKRERPVRFCEGGGVRSPSATRRNIYVGIRVAGNRMVNGVRIFLERTLKLRINTEKSAVARPWERKFLGFSVTAHRESRLRIAPASVQRLRQKVRDLMRAGRGRSLAHTIDDLNPLLRGWINYFRLTESKGILEDLDGWVWRRLRCLLWRQWKRPATRARKLRALGMEGDRAFHSASNGQGPWWNAGASHMNHALPAKYFTAKGLVSLMEFRTNANPGIDVLKHPTVLWDFAFLCWNLTRLANCGPPRRKRPLNGICPATAPPNSLIFVPHVVRRRHFSRLSSGSESASWSAPCNAQAETTAGA
jgi:hypothetical protein